MSKLQISFSQLSNKGVKEQNEDAFGIVCPQDYSLESKGIAAAIADGMGSCEFPREASNNCVNGFLNDYYSTPDSWTVKSSAAKVLTALNSWMTSKGFDSHAKAYVSTFSGIIFKSTTAHIFHVGDSRVYRYRDGELKQLTRDHRVWVSQNNSYLSRAIGIDVHLDIDYKSCPLELEDIFLMTTDGIHDYVSDTRICQIIETSDSLESIAKNLLDTALAQNSQDNMSCQLIQIQSLSAQKAEEVLDALVELPFPPDLEPGMVLDQYKVLREINASARSQLYLVEDQLTGETLVMKTPSVNFEDDPTYLEQFYLEEWAGKRLNHPNLLITYDCGKNRTRRKRSALYILMEYVEGITLSQWIKENPMPDIQTVYHIVDQIIKGVRAIHRMEMLHRDIKPDNIMIDKNNNIKIIDFGSIKIAGVSEISTPIDRHDLLGTRDYTAPEYLYGIPASKQSDLFSVATLTYELLTGHLPYGDQLGRVNSAKAVCKMKYRPSYQYNPMIPIWMDGALQKALSCEVKSRYDTFSEFFYDLQHPNEKFMDHHIPIIEKNPVIVWQVIAGLSLLGDFILLYLMSR